jgi:hypothetical protein
MHARIEVQATGWDVRDLGSRNGTRVGGQTVTPGIPVSLREGNILQFGDASECWEVVDLAPPEACLFDPRTGERTLPDENGRIGEHVAYELELEQWCHDGMPVLDGALVGDRILAVPPAEIINATQPVRLALDHALIRFRPSHDLEFVDIRIESGGQAPVTFEGRVWALALYVLAMERHEDPQGGWLDVDRLARKAGLDRKVLDVYLLRARDAFTKVGIAGGGGIVEVRPGLRRLGTASFVIDRVG